MSQGLLPINGKRALVVVGAAVLGKGDALLSAVFDDDEEGDEEEDEEADDFTVLLKLDIGDKQREDHAIIDRLNYNV